MGRVRTGRHLRLNVSSDGSMVCCTWDFRRGYITDQIKSDQLRSAQNQTLEGGSQVGPKLKQIQTLYVVHLQSHVPRVSRAPPMP